MGGGTTGVAAIARTRKFIGVELDREKFEAARTRLLRVAEDIAMRKSAMGLACHTQGEIAEACGCDHATAARTIEDLRQTVSGNQMHKAAAARVTLQVQFPKTKLAKLSPPRS
jgi:hypothetical protein